MAYANNELYQTFDDSCLQYIDYAQYERQMFNDEYPSTMIQLARQYWKQLLDGYDSTKKLQLPYDHVVEMRSGHSSAVTFAVECYTPAIHQYCAENGFTVFAVFMACYYVFLFKLTNFDNDICIGVINANRYRQELENIIGMFDNLVPYRYTIADNSKVTFEHLMAEVHNLCSEQLQYAYLPYQDILKLYPSSHENSTVIQAMLNYSVNKCANLQMGDGRICTLITKLPSGVIKNDLTLSIYEDEHRTLSCSFEYATDVFERTTIETMCCRFQALLQQLFIGQKRHQPLHELSFLLSNEVQLINDMNLTEYADKLFQRCIHEEFFLSAQMHRDKIAIIYEEQCFTYANLAEHVKCLAIKLVKDHHVKAGDIIIQVIERSFEMVVGILAIMATGCIYCPLMSSNPPQRILTLINDTKSHTILIHSETKSKFESIAIELESKGIEIINIEEYVYGSYSVENPCEKLSPTTTKPEDIAYIIYTSGSTGIPKGVLTRHKSFLLCIDAYVKTNILQNNDVVIQTTGCSWDIHIKEVVGTLLVGAQLVIPKSSIEMDYLTKLIQNRSITYIHTVPTFTNTLCEYLEKNMQFDRIKTIRSFCSIGEAMEPKTIAKLMAHLDEKATIYSLYGTTECGIASTYYIVAQKDLNSKIIPVGSPFPNYVCYVLDKFSKLVGVDQIGEIYIGGDGLMAGYLNRDDLNEGVLLSIPEITKRKLYKTGDLARINSAGELLIMGRSDFQIKLRGQRLEVGEIEAVVCRAVPASISKCYIMKQTYEENHQDYLVAYIMAPDISAEADKISLKHQIIEYCQTHLPVYMNPSIFIIMPYLPLNPNGKIDRKQLPKPDFAQLHESNLDYLEPKNELEQEVHNLWCKILHIDKMVSMKSNFFSLGAIASFVQERIWYNENIRFSQSRYAMFNVPYLLKVISGQITIRQLKLAISHIINKNSVLRTSLNYDSNDQCLKQTLKPMLIDDDQHPLYYTFECTSILNKSELEVILFNEETNRTYFDLNKGVVFRCRIIQCSSAPNNDLLSTNDYVIFNFHHIAFDGSCVALFFNDLQLAFGNDNFVYSPEDFLQYTDYSQYEKTIDMTKAKAFWKQLLSDYDLSGDSQLPYDCQLTTDSKRTGLCTCITFELDKCVVDTMIEYARELQVSMFQLCLATFFIYLFNVTNGRTDQCVGSVNANRYRKELQTILGMFVNLSPYRLKIDPNLSFQDIVLQIQQQCLEVLQHAYLPYQEILQLHGQITGNRLPFIETFFQLETSTTSSNDIILGNGTVIRPLLNNEDVIQKHYTSIYDLALLINYDFEARSMECSFSGANDLYTPQTVKKLSERYQILLSQLFASSFDRKQYLLKQL
ncbi:unnamed protein product [Adineta steineri]|uniref:Uncharacterized protein n=1 Tax=Adineta steineri TaxID=433720 RepID=A0A815ZZ55_9BILA|nr:unnamed protein product [Adineta steineri]CAF1589509.1 unnamed protein product [Adineta steineri]